MLVVKPPPASGEHRIGPDDLAWDTTQAPAAVACGRPFFRLSSRPGTFLNGRSLHRGVCGVRARACRPGAWKLRSETQEEGQRSAHGGRHWARVPHARNARVRNKQTPRAGPPPAFACVCILISWAGAYETGTLNAAHALPSPSDRHDACARRVWFTSRFASERPACYGWPRCPDHQAQLRAILQLGSAFVLGEGNFSRTHPE